MSICDNCGKTNYEGSGICDNCKNDCELGCIKELGQGYATTTNECEGYEPLTNRDMLEMKIHEMSAYELYDNNVEQLATNIMGFDLHSNFIEWLNKPYEEEKKYVVFRIIPNGIEYYCECLNEVGSYNRRYKEDATKFTLQQAHEKRNELNNKDPKANWGIAAI